jgi:hypothetical protein
MDDGAWEARPGVAVDDGDDELRPLVDGRRWRDDGLRRRGRRRCRVMRRSAARGGEPDDPEERREADPRS